jgi:hypothetical protein
MDIKKKLKQVFKTAAIMGITHANPAIASIGASSVVNNVNKLSDVLTSSKEKKLPSRAYIKQSIKSGHTISIDKNKVDIKDKNGENVFYDPKLDNNIDDDSNIFIPENLDDAVAKGCKVKINRDGTEVFEQGGDWENDGYGGKVKHGPSKEFYSTQVIPQNNKGYIMPHEKSNMSIPHEDKLIIPLSKNSISEAEQYQETKTPTKKDSKAESTTKDMIDPKPEQKKAPSDHDIATSLPKAGLPDGEQHKATKQNKPKAEKERVIAKLTDLNEMKV